MSRTFRRVLSVLCLWGMVWAACLAPHGARGGDGKVVGFLEKHRVLVTYDGGIGYGNNVYLVPDNEDADLFLSLALSAEQRREIAAAATLHIDAALETKRHFDAGDADELFFDLAGECSLDRTVWSLGASAALAYEDYRAFREEGQ